MTLTHKFWSRDSRPEWPARTELLRVWKTSPSQLSTCVSAPRRSVLPPPQTDVHEHAAIPGGRQARLSARWANITMYYFCTRFSATQKDIWLLGILGYNSWSFYFSKSCLMSATIRALRNFSLILQCRPRCNVWTLHSSRAADLGLSVRS